MGVGSGEHYVASDASPLGPTPAAFAHILEVVSRDMEGAIMAVDIGGATTDVYTARGGEVFRTVSANLGMSYSIRNVAELGGLAAIRSVHPSNLSDSELWNHIGNKHIDPTRLPDSPEDMATEWAVATVAVRKAVLEHLDVMRAIAEESPGPRLDLDILIRGPRRAWQKELRVEGKPDLALEDYGLVIGSGGILSHSPREAAAMILLDALQPNGVVEFAVDSAFMFPHLGVLAEADEDLAKEVFHEIGIVKLGTVFAPTGHERAAVLAVKGRTSGERNIDEKIAPDEVAVIALAGDEKVTLSWPAGGEGESFTAWGGACGLIVDNRTRPISSGAKALISGDYVPPAPEIAADRGERVRSGDIRMARELAIPGQVLVRAGDRVESDTLVARSVEQFLRPFFLSVARDLEVEPGELGEHLVKRVGDQIKVGDVIARKRRRMLPSRVYRSGVEGRIEKILDNGTLVVRESPELAREYTTVNVAEDLGRPAWEIKPYVRVEPGQHVERGQWLAADFRGGALKFSASPVRGKVNRINNNFGMVVIEPLLEELEIYAWLPGVVESTSETGCVVAAAGTVINGVWGLGGEASGALTVREPSRGKVVVRQFAGSDLLSELKEKEIAGLVTGGLNLQDMIGAEPGFTVVVLEGFGEKPVAREIMDLLEAHEGKLALIDGTTQLRVGVVRPRVILP